MNKLDHLFSPLELRGVEISNRIVNLPHGTLLADPFTALVSEIQVKYYEERAKGGVGLIVMGGTFVHPTSFKRPGCNQVWNDSAIPGLRMIADAVHQYDTKIFGQLSHTGRQGTSDYSSLPLWAPSAIPCPVNREMPHAMDQDEVEELIYSFGQTARRFKEAGFDGVEIYAGQGYLLCEFLSPFSNIREDQYGGEFDNRIRLVRQVIDVVRGQIGEDYPVGIRLSGDEFTDTGIDLEQAVEIAKAIESTGKIDYINQTQCNYNTFYTMCPDMSFPLAPFSYLAAEFRRSVELPVCAAGRITDPLLAERLLAEGQADMIGMCRPLICDPELPTKAKEGRLDDIRYCISCNEGCIGRNWRQAHIGCIQNPAVGQEKDLGIGTLKPTKVRKRVMVVGAGPAGMEAARVAAERGHEVILYEKRESVGGQVTSAARVSTREGLADVVRYLSVQLEKLRVCVLTGVEVTPEIVAQSQPDVVVVATGSVPQLKPVPGFDGRVLDVVQVLNGQIDLGEKVVIVDGGEAHWKFCGTGEFLAQAGKTVEMISPVSSIGMEIEAFGRVPLLMRLGQKGVRMSPSTSLAGGRGRTLVVVDVWSGVEREIEEVDSVILAYHNRADDGLCRALKGRVEKLYAIGDCVAPRKIMDAMREGFLLGRNL